MDKTELLADITAKSLKVVSTTEEIDVAKNNAGVRSYITNVIEQNGERVTGRNIGWYTIDEGTANEKAFYRDQIVPKSVARDLIDTYMVTISPSPYIRYEIKSVNEENRSAEVSVIKDVGGGSATKLDILVYKNGGNPITHVELTN